MPTCRFNGAWNGRAAGRSRRRRTSAAILSAERRDDRNRVRVREPRHASAADEHDEDGCRRRDVDRARRRAEPGVQKGEPLRQRALDRQPLEQLLGVAERQVRGRHQQQRRCSDQRDGDEMPRPRRSRQMLRQPCERRVRPERLIDRRHEQDEQECTRHRRQSREQGDEEARALQGLQTRRPQFVRRSGNGIAATDGGERKGEAEEVDEQRIERRASQSRLRATGGEARRPQGTGPRASVTRPQTVTSVRIPTAIQTPLAIRSDVRSNPIRARSHKSPISDAATIVAKSSGRRKPVSRHPAMAVRVTVEAYWPMTMQARAARRSRSTRPAAAAAFAARGPNACWTRATAPPGISSAQLSMSMARTNAPTIAAASTNQAAESPSDDRAMPATKNAATPSCAMASAAAFRTDMKERSAVDERTTRI